jgi:hypothetical protein
MRTQILVNVFYGLTMSLCWKRLERFNHLNEVCGRFTQIGVIWTGTQQSQRYSTRPIATSPEEDGGLINRTGPAWPKVKLTHRWSISSVLQRT